ncbi:MAG TPA: AAA family ATPase [Terriglobales bacterium]|jgi:hypothetical protein|nr:AAA family ATPase [Terriglobales bacterium]
MTATPDMDWLTQTEKAVLASVILDSDLWAEASELEPEHFYLDSHRLIYSGMAALAESAKPIDLVTLQAELSQRGQLKIVGGAVYLAALTDLVPKRKSIRDFISSIKIAAAKRSAALQFDNLSRQSQNGATIPELISGARSIVERLSQSECSAGGIDKLPDPLELPRLQEPWLVHGLLLRGGVTLLAGSPGDGKTFLALAAARAVAMGSEWLGQPCENTRVLILDKENPKTVIQQRWRSIFGGPVAGHVSIWAGWSGLGEVPGLDDPRLLEFAKRGPLLIFDSLVRFHDGDENSAAEMAPTTKKIRALANAGASVLLIHHRGKSEINKYRGSTEILANSDIACSLSKSEADGLLTLDVFKTRGTSEFKLTIQPDFETGRFPVVSSPATTQKRSDVAALAEVITANPGLPQTKVIEMAGIGRTAASQLLTANCGKLWRTERGTHGSLRYYAISSTAVPTCTEYTSTR